VDTQALIKKWESVLEHSDYASIKDAHRKGVTAQLLENQKIALGQQSEVLSEDTAPTNVTANVGKYDPILISLVRRSMPNLIAYDVCGVQPMTGPTGLIFAMRPKYAPGTPPALGTEAFYNEADSDFSGTGTQAGTDPSVLNLAVPGTYTNGSGMATAVAEQLGSDTGTAFAQMGFEIEKVVAEAKSRALKAQYSVELAQDLKQIHGLDAETELANILSSEILAEINREIIRTIYVTAKPGAQSPELTTAGTFDLDTDSNGRWMAEKFKSLLWLADVEANAVARETRRGKGNFIICSSDVASALSISGMLDYAPALSTDLQVDDTGNTFAGILNGRYRVFVDPYATGNFLVIGYKGASSYDAGLFYGPYVPLQMYKAVSDETFQPKIGFKTRYSLTANPFAQGLTKGNGALNANSNVYFRRVKITNLHGTAL
jgi:Major capsid protein Gp23